MPDAMMFNERISTICVTPNKNSVRKKIPDGSYVLKNNLQRVNKPCKGRYSWPGLRVDNSSATPVVELRGKISKKCGNRNLCQVITKPYKSFYYALRANLKKSGISVGGGMRLNKVPRNAKKLFTHHSRSLEKIISRTAKKSNNLYARHLLLYLGAKMYGAPATLKKGRQAVEYILKSRGALPKGTLSIDNGCGLSRTAKLNTKLLAEVLDDGYSRYGMRWMKTLSIAGVDGTIKRRFRGTIVRNRAWMKTGTLKRVKNISGYVKSKNGRMYTVVILVNSKAGNWKASQLQNNVMKWLVKYKGRGVAQRAVTSPKKERRAEGQNRTSFTPGYYIQTGSFSHAPTNKYLSKIKALGMKYKTESNGNYKVLVGPYSAEADARRTLQKVRKNINKDAFLVSKTETKKEGVIALY
jgi:D-alanyl-D-alanine carboxypeptidase/D-alanyl-D-alanine-endopeptidase (penicillin-binding protein 4)